MVGYTELEYLRPQSLNSSHVMPGVVATDRLYRGCPNGPSWEISSSTSNDLG